MDAVLPSSRQVIVLLERLRPQGIPLTEPMSFAAEDGVCWLAYIEGYPRTPSRRLLSQTILPGRRLRFDSVTESRVTDQVPAGSPFLTEARLRALLVLAHPFPPPVSTPSRAATPALRPSSVIALARRHGTASGAHLADWLRRNSKSLVSAGSDLLHLGVERLLLGRRARS